MMRLTSFLFLCIVLFSCKKEGCDISGHYQFRLPVELSPVQDTFKIGDTIYIHSEFSHMVYEEKTAQHYELKDFQFYPTVAISKLDTAEVNTNAGRFFVLDTHEDVEFESHVFNSSGSYRFIGEYTYTNNVYYLGFNLIPQRPGLYVFDITSFLNPQDPDQDFEGKCRGKSSEAYMRLNDGNEILNNHSLLYHSHDSSFVNAVLEESQLHGSFIFYVENDEVADPP